MRRATEIEILTATALEALGDVIGENLEKHGEFGFLKKTNRFHLSKAVGHIMDHLVAVETHSEEAEDHLAHALTRIVMAITVEDFDV